MKKGSYLKKLSFFCRPGEARTLDPMIKSHVLYQLSYGPYFGITKIVILNLQLHFALEKNTTDFSNVFLSVYFKPSH